MSSRKKVDDRDRRFDDPNTHLEPKNSRRAGQPHGSGRDRSRSNTKNEAGRDSPSSTLDRASPRRPDRSFSSKGSIRSRGGRSSEKDYNSRSRSRPRDEDSRRDTGKYFGDDRDTRRSDYDLPHKSPGFGRNSEYNDDRLETFGRKDDHEPRSQYTPGFKGSQPMNREENNDPNKQRPFGSQSEYRGKPPPPGGNRDRYEGKDRGTRTTNVNPPPRRGNTGDPRRSQYEGSQRGGRPVSTADSRLNEHIDRKLSKKGFREPNFIENKKTREKGWMLDYNSHKPIPSKLNKTNENPKDTVSYIIIINGVTGIPAENIPQLKDKNKKATVNYCVTMYEEKEREFFGRTYFSKPIQTTPSGKETENKEFIYIHTATPSPDI